MAEVLVQFTRPVVGSSGQAYLSRVCGRLRELTRTYGLLDNPAVDLWRMSKAALVGLALAAVRERLR